MDAGFKAIAGSTSGFSDLGHSISTLLNFAPVCDAHHFDVPDFVIDGIDHAVTADADAPQVSSADELLATLGSVPSALIFGKMRPDIESGSRKNSFSALDFSATRYSGTQLASLDSFRFDLLQRNAFLIAARLGDQNVLDRLP